MASQVEPERRGRLDLAARGPLIRSAETDQALEKIHARRTAAATASEDIRAPSADGVRFFRIPSFARRKNQIVLDNKDSPK
jgi:hypothetical protein